MYIIHYLTLYTYIFLNSHFNEKAENLKFKYEFEKDILCTEHILCNINSVLK